MAGLYEHFVFWVDQALTRPTRRLGMFITTRLRDYEVWLVPSRGDSAVVRGRGATHGDALGRWAFPFDTTRAEPPVPAAADEAREEVDGSPPLPPDCWPREQSTD